MILSYSLRHPLSAIDTLVALSLGQRHCYFDDFGIWSETYATPLLLWYIQFYPLCATATLVILSSGLRHLLSAIAPLVGLFFWL